VLRERFHFAAWCNAGPNSGSVLREGWPLMIERQESRENSTLQASWLFFCRSLSAVW
jgi:hypothetical protein